MYRPGSAGVCYRNAPAIDLYRLQVVLGCGYAMPCCRCAVPRGIVVCRVAACRASAPAPFVDLEPEVLQAVLGDATRPVGLGDVPERELEERAVHAEVVSAVPTSARPPLKARARALPRRPFGPQPEAYARLTATCHALSQLHVVRGCAQEGRGERQERRRRTARSAQSGMGSSAAWAEGRASGA
jgi:hypothetical protein